MTIVYSSSDPSDYEGYGDEVFDDFDYDEDYMWDWGEHGYAEED